MAGLIVGNEFVHLLLLQASEDHADGDHNTENGDAVNHESHPAASNGDNEERGDSPPDPKSVGKEGNIQEMAL